MARRTASIFYERFEKVGFILAERKLRESDCIL